MWRNWNSHMLWKMVWFLYNLNIYLLCDLVIPQIWISLSKRNKSIIPYVDVYMHIAGIFVIAKIL